jgi:bacterioferritin-associated ferredoxin
MTAHHDYRSTFLAKRGISLTMRLKGMANMEWDDEICLCFHVSKRKLVNWIRIEKPAKAPLISECGGAGTGCGWCRPMLERLFREGQTAKTANGNQPATPDSRANPSPADADSSQPETRQELTPELSAQEYAARRQAYLQQKKQAKSLENPPTE